MLKIIGAFLIISGTTAWGACSVMRMRARVKSLNAIVWSLDFMREEICTNLTPMPELLELMQKAAPQPVSELYEKAHEKIGELGKKSFSEIWKSAIEETPSLLLEQEEREILTELGGSLGKYDFESQGRIIQSARRKLEAKAAKAETERMSNSRLHAFLGVAAGMFAVVVLI